VVVSSAMGVTTDMVSLTSYPPNGYVGYGFDNGLAVGVGVVVPFGLGTEWPADWAGIYLAARRISRLS
jgi:long-subunit fatty acid transport protein